MSQRMQSFVCDSALNPLTWCSPAKTEGNAYAHTRVKDGKPLYCFSVQGGDTQDQNLLQCFLNMTEFGMNVQEATEAPNINTYQFFYRSATRTANQSRALYSSITIRLHGLRKS